MSNNSNQDTLASKIKNIASILDVFNIQSELENYFIQLHLSGIIEQILEALQEQEIIPFIDELLDIIFSHNSVISHEREIDNLELYITRKYPIKIRLHALQHLVKLRPQKSSILLVNLALDQEDSKEVRIQAIKSLKQLTINTSELYKLLNIFNTDNDDLIIEVMQVFSKHHEQAPYLDVQKQLKKLLYFNNESIKCQAIELLGIFGEINIIEEVCLINNKTDKIKTAIANMVKKLNSKPINLLYLRPENFEYVIKQLLQHLDYDDVVVTPLNKDGGIDVIAYKKGFGVTENQKQRVVVQCKRYSSQTISEKDIENLLTAMQYQQATEGYFIATSGFSEQAQKLGASNRHLVLIDKVKLQELLDKAFGINKYCIIFHK